MDDAVVVDSSITVAALRLPLYPGATFGGMFENFTRRYLQLRLKTTDPWFETAQLAYLIDLYGETYLTYDAVTKPLFDFLEKDSSRTPSKRTRARRMVVHDKMERIWRQRDPDLRYHGISHFFETTYFNAVNEQAVGPGRITWRGKFAHQSMSPTALYAVGDSSLLPLCMGILDHGRGGTTLRDVDMPIGQVHATWLADLFDAFALCYG